MIIDSHTHLGKHNNHDFTAEELIESMKAAGIDMSLVIANKSTHSGTGFSADELLEKCAPYPQLKVIGNIDYKAIDAVQVAHLKELLEQKKIFGVKIYPGYDNFAPTDPKLEEIFKYCEDNGYPVIFHTGILAVYKTGYLKQSHPLNIDEVATNYPNLTIVMAHVGNPWFMDCAAVLYRHKNVYADLSAYFDEFQTIPESAVANFVKDVLTIKEYVGNFKKFLFGTDFPLYSQKEYLEAAKRLPIPEEEREIVFSENAKKIFKI